MGATERSGGLSSDKGQATRLGMEYLRHEPVYTGGDPDSGRHTGIDASLAGRVAGWARMLRASSQVGAGARGEEAVWPGV